MPGPLKIYKDTADKGDAYASRNVHDFCDNDGHLLDGHSSDLYFKHSLRQGSRVVPRNTSMTIGAPAFCEVRSKPSPPPSQWFFNDPEYTDASFGNFAAIANRVHDPLRFVPSSGLKWELDLRPSPPSRTQHSPKLLIPHTDLSTPSDTTPGPLFSSQWIHLMTPDATRSRLHWETSLRGLSSNRVGDTLAPLIGKKKLHFKPPKDSIVASDPKLAYLG